MIFISSVTGWCGAVSLSYVLVTARQGLTRNPHLLIQPVASTKDGVELKGARYKTYSMENMSFKYIVTVH